MVTYPVSEENLVHEVPQCAITTSLTSEEKILILCGRLHLETADKHALAGLLNHSLDWRDLTKQAYRHGVLPLLYWHLNTLNARFVPVEVMTQLRQLFQQNARSNLLLTGELFKLLDVFENQNIPAVPYKGPVLASTVYGNLALRSFVDIDILIHRDHREKAKEILLARGFTLKQHTPHSAEPDEFAYAFIDPTGLVYVEIHWGLTPGHFPFPLNMDQLWQSLKTVSLSNRPVAHIAPDLLFIVLCVHGCRHRWLRLNWIVDVAELIRQHPLLDWPSILELAKETGSLRMVWIGLHLVQKLFGMALPHELDFSSAPARQTEALAAQVQHWLFTPPKGVSGDIEMYLFFYHMRERRVDKYKYLTHMISMRLKPNEQDEAFIEISPGWKWLYYLTRPYRLFKEYGKATWHYLFGDRQA